jgi:hypothetical protein
MRRIEFAWVNFRVQLASDDPVLVDYVRRLWGAHVEAGSARDIRAYEALVYGKDAPRLVGPRGVVELDRRHPTLHAYHSLIADLLGAVADHFAFHATALERDGWALVLSAPSTFGKTTLGIHLAGNGFALLADDVTFMERASGRVMPFRRALNLRAGTRATMDAATLDLARGAVRASSSDEWTVDPAPWSSARNQPCRLGMVVLAGPHEEGTGYRRFPRYEILVVEGREQILEELSSLPGVAAVDVTEAAGGRARVGVDRSEPLLGWLRSHQADIVTASRLVADPPDFSGSPRLEALGPFQAAVELTQEMLNRHDGSLLDAEFRGRETVLIAEVARLLKGTTCLALSPGRLKDTVALLVSTFDKRRH